jgi:hypothetical protein
MDSRPINLSAHLTDDDLIPDSPRLERLAAIASAGSTHPEGVEAFTTIRCAWPPSAQDPRDCPGRIRTVWHDTDAIARVCWSCSVCAETGVVFGYEDTSWDQRAERPAPDCPAHLVPLTLLDALDQVCTPFTYRAIVLPEQDGVARTWATPEEIDDTTHSLAEMFEYYQREDRADEGTRAYRQLLELLGRVDAEAEATRLCDAIDPALGYSYWNHDGFPRHVDLDLHARVFPDATRTAVGPRLAAMRNALAADLVSRGKDPDTSYNWDHHTHHLRDACLRLGI